MNVLIEAFGVSQEIRIATEAEVNIHITSDDYGFLVRDGIFALRIYTDRAVEVNVFTVRDEKFSGDVEELVIFLSTLLTYGIIVPIGDHYDIQPTLRRGIVMIGQWINTDHTPAQSSPLIPIVKRPVDNFVYRGLASLSITI